MEFLEDNDPMMLNAQFEPIPEENPKYETRLQSRNSQADRLGYAGNLNAQTTTGAGASLSPNKLQSRHSSNKSVTASAHQKPNEVGKYSGEEDNIICGRFPHMDVCACDIQCSIALREINLFEVYPGILMGPY